MNHPFNLSLSDLQAVEISVERLTDEEAGKVLGGVGQNSTTGKKKWHKHATLNLKHPCKVKEEPVYTTLAIGEEGGTFTTQAIGEEGGW